MRTLVYWAFGINLIFPCFQSPAEKPDIAMLQRVPSITIAGHTYQCGEMVQVVNRLRQLGKDKSLAILREYLLNGGEFGKVLVICRLLFVNPKGWEPPILGSPVPAINEKVANEFPLFPIALSNRVPFLLVGGYDMSGKPESATQYLELCESFALIKEDYPVEGYETAARALIETNSFRQLYQRETRRDYMADIILRQAKTAKAPEKK